jgi:hypothetical protein
MDRRTTHLGLAPLLLAAACGGGTRAAKGPPEWFHNPPKGARTLFFVGDATGAPDEATARELAVQKALSELTVYCGATIKSDFQSVEREANGKYEQMVSMTVDIAGEELTIREAVVKQTVVGESGKTFDAWALIEWPRTQYEAVLQAQRARAMRALALFLEAETATSDRRVGDANTKLREAQDVLGPMKAQIPIDHQQYHNSALLQDAMMALRLRLKEIGLERKKVMAVVLNCSLDGNPASCRDEWVGEVRQIVSGSGFKVSADNVSSTLASAILTSSSPQTDATVRSSGYVVAARYDAKLTAHEDGVHYVHCGARAVVFDTDANRILQVKEVAPIKGAHPQQAGAIKLACNKAGKEMIGWLQTELANFK